MPRKKPLAVMVKCSQPPGRQCQTASGPGAPPAPAGPRRPEGQEIVLPGEGLAGLLHGGGIQGMEIHQATSGSGASAPAG